MLLAEYTIKAGDLKRRDTELGRGQNGVVYAAATIRQLRYERYEELRQKTVGKVIATAAADELDPVFNPGKLKPRLLRLGSLVLSSGIG